MPYYKVLPISAQFRSSDDLVYSSDHNLDIGSIVSISLRQKIALGIITETTTSKGINFTIKPIKDAYDGPSLPRHSMSLIKWLAAHYGCHTSQAATLFVPTNLFSTQRTSVPQVKKDNIAESAIPPLTLQQSSAVSTIISSSDHSHMLHGITGSGKTRVYIELIKYNLSLGKSSIILTPEIGLTPQLFADISPFMPKNILYVTHSKQTVAQRTALWKKMHRSTKTPLVLIGPRSALFYPMHQLGLIVVDEIHDSSYKQDQSPRYHATHVAGKLAQLVSGKTILGSATPPVSDYYVFRKRSLPIISLTEKATNRTADSTKTIVDTSLRNNFTQSAWLSNKLIELIKKSLSKKQQSLLYLNRRGTARAVVCQDCQWRAICSSCDSSLVYHADLHIALCHHCGKKEPPPQRCKECENDNINYSSMGTKFLESEVLRLFPEATVARFDSDNVKSESLEAMYQEVRNGHIDIIIGTQTIAKGLDLPHLSIVGVLQADQSLQHPDFMAEEQLFQHIVQLIGRVGRGHTHDNHVVVQTSQPANIALQAAINEDYHQFYKSEIAHRRKRNYPPFVYLSTVYIELASATAAQKKLNQLASDIRRKHPQVTVSIPAPATQEKRRGKYRWQIVIKAKQRRLLTAIALSLPASFRHDIDPQRLL